MDKYPISLALADEGHGISGSSVTSFQYTCDGSSYCLTAIPSRIGLPTYFVSNTQSMQQGVCPGHAAGPTGTVAVSAVAGTGSSGYVDGTGTGASFYGPSGIASDNNGNFYITDVSSHRIRKITAACVVTTVAGTSQGNTDGPVASAKFYHPYGVAVASDGTVYIADTYNNRIRKVSGGNASTLAGSSSGNADGVGAAASFSQPMDLVVSKAGTIYVADRGNSRVRSVTTGGTVATVAGTTSGYANGPAVTAKFNDIYGLTLSVGEGRLYVTEGFGYRLRMIQL